MRYNVIVHVPQGDNVAYTLFAKGMNVSVPYLNQKESEYVFKFLGGSVFVLFYNFGSFKKAYAVTCWQDIKDGSPVCLPGVNESLCVLFTACGSKYKILDSLIKSFTRNNDFSVFQLPLEFWYKIGILLNERKDKSAYIRYLFDAYISEWHSMYYIRKDRNIED